MSKNDKCPICGKPRGRNKYTCSRECFAILKTQKKTCIICGTIFNDPSCNMTKTCSPECSKQNRSRLHASGIYAGSLEKAHEVGKNHPLTGRFETHMHAKSWVIKSPEGKVYECRNLKNWLREHEHLIDGTIKQAWDGITKIKYTMQGKRKHPSKSWKGWTLLEYGD